MEAKRIYIRNLPHLQPEDGVFSLVFRLDGSLPTNVIFQLQEERAQFQREITKHPEKAKKNSLFTEERISYFQKFDCLLDNPTSGPLWLKDEKIAGIVKDTIIF